MKNESFETIKWEENVMSDKGNMSKICFSVSIVVDVDQLEYVVD